jgi:Asp/Glu/hydantoin racemase
MQILYVNPSATGEFDDYFHHQLAGCAGPDVDVIVRHLDLPGWPQTPFVPDNPAYLGPMFQALTDAQEEGFDAAVIGCCDDPGLLDARRALDMPVVGPLEAGLHLASLLHSRVAILVPDGFNSHILDADNARIYGLSHIISEIQIIPMNYPDEESSLRLLREDPELLRSSIIGCHTTTLDGYALEVARAAVRRGAGVIFPACTLWSGEMLEAFRDALGVPVIDPGRGAVLMAAAAARARRLHDTASGQRMADEVAVMPGVES